MIKTIKVKKQLRLDELIKHIFDNGVEDKSFFTPTKSGMIYPYTEVRVNGLGNIELTGCIGDKDTFTVEVEEKITEDTKFKTLLEINNAGELYHYKNTTISSMSRASSKYFHAIINGKLQLIWEAE